MNEIYSEHLSDGLCGVTAAITLRVLLVTNQLQAQNLDALQRNIWVKKSFVLKPQKC